RQRATQLSRQEIPWAPPDASVSAPYFSLPALRRQYCQGARYSPALCEYCPVYCSHSWRTSLVCGQKTRHSSKDTTAGVLLLASYKQRCYNRDPLRPAPELTRVLYYLDSF